MAKNPKNPHRGTRVDDWLKEEGIFEDVTQKAIKEVIAWQLAEAMKAEHITKTDASRHEGNVGQAPRRNHCAVLSPFIAGVSRCRIDLQLR